MKEDESLDDSAVGKFGAQFQGELENVENGLG